MDEPDKYENLTASEENAIVIRLGCISNDIVKLCYKVYGEGDDCAILGTAFAIAFKEMYKSRPIETSVLANQISKAIPPFKDK
jgi:hypothetical protein